MISILIKELNETREGVYNTKYLATLDWLGYFKNRDEVQNNIQNNS